MSGLITSPELSHSELQHVQQLQWQQAVGQGPHGSESASQPFVRSPLSGRRYLLSALTVEEINQVCASRICRCHVTEHTNLHDPCACALYPK